MKTQSFKSRGSVSLKRSFTSSADVGYGCKLNHLSFEQRNQLEIWTIMSVASGYIGQVSPTIQALEYQVKI
jgi:hypothetical protein